MWWILFPWLLRIEEAYEFFCEALRGYLFKKKAKVFGSMPLMFSSIEVFN